MEKFIVKPDFRLRAIIEHGGQMYGEHPYAFHLAYVENFIIKYGFDSDTWRAAAWLHDSLEDTEFSKNDMVRLYGSEVFDLVWAVTGEGANRKERNASIRKKLEYFPKACVLKTADRIANVTHARRNRTRQYDMYTDEYPAFREMVENYVPEEMLKRLDGLFE